MVFVPFYVYNASHETTATVIILELVEQLTIDSCFSETDKRVQSKSKSDLIAGGCVRLFK